MNQLQVGDRVRWRVNFLEPPEWNYGTVTGFTHTTEPMVLLRSDDTGREGGMPLGCVSKLVELPKGLKRYPNSEVYLGEIYLGNVQSLGWRSYGVIWCPPGRSAVDAGTVDNPDFGLWLLWQAHIKGRLPDGQSQGAICSG